MATATSPKCSKGTASQPQDCCWSVPIVAMCACFLLCMAQSSTGYLYVLFMDKYQINRGLASWPESIIMLSQNLGGFLVTLLLTRMSIYSVTLVSLGVSFVGLACAAFAPNIAWMLVTLGAVYGVGVGASTVSFTVFTMLYFDKYRATATAFKFVGWAASGVAGPLVLSTLATRYGLGGTLLLSSSIALHAVPLVMCVQYPRPVVLNWCQCKSLTHKTGSCEGGAPKEEKCDRKRSALGASLSPRKQELSSSVKAGFRTEQQAVFTRQEIGVNSISAVCDRTAVSASPPPCRHASRSCTGFVTSGTAREDSKELGMHNSFIQIRAQRAEKESNKRSTLIENLSGQLTLFRDPVFYILLIAFTLCECSVSMHTTTTVDYGRDKGVAMEDATLIITYNALGQILGRTLLPFASDSVANGRCKFAVACYGAAAVWYGVLSAVRSFPAFVALNVALGVSEGFVTCIRSVLVNDYLGVDRLATFFGFQGVALLPLCLTEPTIIGFFRDNLGSYDNFYRMLGAVNLCMATLLFILLWRDTMRLKKFTLPNMNHPSPGKPLCVLGKLSMFKMTFMNTRMSLSS